MSGSLLLHVWIFVASAFGLGLGVGWLFWRFHRASVPRSEWLSCQGELISQRQRIQESMAERDALAGQVARVRGESSHLVGLLTDVWQEREVLRARVIELDRQTVILRDELDHAAVRARYLQRRVTEWSVTNPPGNGSPADPAASNLFSGRSGEGALQARRPDTPPAALTAPASVDPTPH